MTHAFIVGRRRKGRHVGRVVREVRVALQAVGWRVRERTVTGRQDLARAAAEAVQAGVDVVVAVGGDGTVRLVASAVADTPIALGVIATGTGNLVAANLGIPRARAAAIRTVVHGRRRTIDLGRVEADGAQHDFVLACGVGFDAEVIQRTHGAQKRRLGRLAYLASVLARTGTIRNVPHRLSLDGVEYSTEAAQVYIANFGGMLRVLQPRRAIRPDDGLFDVVVARASGPLPALVAGWEALRQQHLGESARGRVFRAQARTVRVTTDPARLVEVDGSLVGRTPITVSMRPGALTVLVPARSGTFGLPVS